MNMVSVCCTCLPASVGHTVLSSSSTPGNQRTHIHSDVPLPWPRRALTKRRREPAYTAAPQYVAALPLYVGRTHARPSRNSSRTVYCRGADVHDRAGHPQRQLLRLRHQLRIPYGDGERFTDAFSFATMRVALCCSDPNSATETWRAWGTLDLGEILAEKACLPTHSCTDTEVLSRVYVAATPGGRVHSALPATVCTDTRLPLQYYTCAAYGKDIPLELRGGAPGAYGCRAASLTGPYVVRAWCICDPTCRTVLGEDEHELAHDLPTCAPPDISSGQAGAPRDALITAHQPHVHILMLANKSARGLARMRCKHSQGASLRHPRTSRWSRAQDI